MSEKEIEKEIKEKGLTAPRLKPEDIDKAIKLSKPHSYLMDLKIFFSIEKTFLE
jgi:hypothetical protein